MGWSKEVGDATLLSDEKAASQAFDRHVYCTLCRLPDDHADVRDGGAFGHRRHRADV
jgi:hypothetical protein